MSDDAIAKISLPKMTDWKITQIYDYEQNIVDYETLEELDKSIQMARKAAFILAEKINKYERQEKLKKIEYNRAYRRAYFNNAEKTESARKIRAELVCEEIENELVKFQQLKEELIRTSHTVRQELQALQLIGNNLRQQLKLM